MKTGRGCESFRSMQLRARMRRPRKHKNHGHLCLTVKLSINTQTLYCEVVTRGGHVIWAFGSRRSSMMGNDRRMAVRDACAQIQRALMAGGNPNRLIRYPGRVRRVIAPRLSER